MNLVRAGKIGLFTMISLFLHTGTAQEIPVSKVDSCVQQVLKTFNVPGIAVGIVNSILMAGGALHNPMVGTILKYMGDTSLQSYRIAFSTLSFFFLCAVLFSFLLSESYPKKLTLDMSTK